MTDIGIRTNVIAHYAVDAPPPKRERRPGRVSLDERNRAYSIRRRQRLGLFVRPQNLAWLARYDADPRVQRSKAIVQAPTRSAEDTIKIVAAIYRVRRGTLLMSAANKRFGGAVHQRNAWPRAVLAWAMRAAGHQYTAIGVVLGIERGTVRSRCATVDRRRLQSSEVRAETDRVVARDPVVVYHVPIGSPLWCVIDAFEEQAELNDIALNHNALADRGAE